MFSGLLSGNLGVVKSLLTEITDDTNRGAAFSYMSLAWAIGTVIAPLAGGMLCKPAVKYPTVFPDKKGNLFVEFPYLLPCLVCVAWSLFSALWCFIFMKETRNVKKSISGKELSKKAENINNIEMVTVGNKIISRMTGSKTPTTSGYSRVDAEGENDDESVGFGDLDLESGDFGSPATSEQKYSKLQAHLKHGLVSQHQQQQQGDSDDAAACTSPATVSTADESTSTDVYSPVVALQHSAAQKTHVSKDMFVIGGGSSSDEEGTNTGGGRGGGGNSPSLVHGKHGRISIDMTRALADQERLDIKDNNQDTSLGAETDTQRSSSNGHSSEGTDDEDEDWDEEDQLCCASRRGDTDSTSLSTTSMDSSSHNLTSNSISGGVSGGASGGEPARMSTSSVLRQRVVVLATGNYGMLAAASILLEETLPLFLKAPINEGGFGFDSAHIGLLLSISGCVMLIFTSYFLPIISRRSKFWMFKVGVLGSVPVALSLPFIALLNRNVLSSLSDTAHWWVLWTLLPLVNVCKSVFACLAFGAVMIQVNHSVHDEYLGAVNGLGQSLAALARAIGPALGGALWSLSTRHHFVYLNFIVTAAAFTFCLYLNQLLPPSLDYKKRVRNAKNAGKAGEGDGAGASAPMFH